MGSGGAGACSPLLPNRKAAGRPPIGGAGEAGVRPLRPPLRLADAGGRGGRQSVRWRGGERSGALGFLSPSSALSRRFCQPPSSFAAGRRRSRPVPGTSGEGGAFVMGPSLRERLEAKAGV